MSRRILWITPKWPLPADDGARVATAGLLKGLAALGTEIHLVAVAAPDERRDAAEAVAELGVASARAVPRSSPPRPPVARALWYGRALAGSPLLPLTMAAYRAPGVTAVISREAAAGASFVVYDGLHPAAHAYRGGVYSPDGCALPIIYRAHNRESDLWARKLATIDSPLAAAFLRFQERRVRAFEDSLVRRAAGVATVSPEDLAAFETAGPVRNGAVVPIGYEFPPPPSWPGGDLRRIMFIGRLDWHPNRDGLRWFLERVWPKVVRRRTDLHLTIAGSGDGGWLRPLVAGAERVTFAGRVESVAGLYEESMLSIVPLFYGSGTRVKVIEACRFARPCISTAVGVEGVGLSPGRDYFPAESEHEWVEALVGFDPARARSAGESARARALETFDAASTARRFRELLDAAAPRAGTSPIRREGP